jgi:anti-sigma B factor antagonist
MNPFPTDRSSDAYVSVAPECTPLRLTMHGKAPRGRLRLTGELDAQAAPLLVQTVRQLRDWGYRYLVLDLSGLSFLSAAGMHALQTADRLLRGAAGGLVVAHPTDRARRLLRLTGLDTILTLYPRTPPSSEPGGTARPEDGSDPGISPVTPTLVAGRHSSSCTGNRRPPTPPVPPSPRKPARAAGLGATLRLVR